MSAKKPPRLHQQASGVWYVLYSGPIRDERKSLRTKDPEVAQERFKGWLEQDQVEKEMCEDPTISFCLDLWMDQWIVGNMLSEIRYPSVVNNLKRHFGDKTVSKVEMEDSKEYAQLRRSGVIGRKGAAEGTIRHELVKLRACLRFMMERVEPRERRIDPKQVPYIVLPKNSPPRELVLTREQLLLLYNYCMEDYARAGSRHQGPEGWITREARFCIIAMETAARKTAILELTWDLIDLDRKILQLNPHGREQTSKYRPTIRMSSKLIVMLKRIYPLRKNELILDSKTEITHGLKRIVNDLGLPEETSPHTFRHTWATHASEEGVPMKKIAKFLGDSEETVRKNYEHLSPDFLDDVVDRPLQTSPQLVV